ncbi:TonB-dependent receptor domain-containing protein [Sphingomonas baiyangensis]|uniref:TonB-dependent receptor n=1 Tax=Sphingomonas baiyangensis TaxID=2572576 RepID=A0A4U1L5Z1_9SPHN|nr:TonB-dependent receptor [Sphingomonas baiyangensis]TKD52262.1 TonB-dependent receptor [Sphingomonas baiyangensis]
MRSNFRQHLLTTAVLVGATVAAPAFAQEAVPSIQGAGVSAEVDPRGADQDTGTIVVTGSRIQRPDLTSTSPLTVVSSEEFQLSGATNVEQVLNTLPQVLPGVTGFSNNPGNGAVTLNLRNLGATRTLVLVNGRRWMFYDTNQIVDLNTIPQFMVEGVDVVTGGASAVYGSDAIAGVVNFRLRQDLNGIIMGGQYNITERGDGARYNIDFAMGSDFADGRGNVALFANYTQRKPIFQNQRDFSRFAAGDGCIRPGTTNPDTGIGQNLGGALGTCVSRGGELGLIPQGSASTPIASLPSVTSPSGLGYIFNPTGGGVTPFLDPDNLYNFAPDNYLQLPQERYLIGAYGNYEVTEGVELFTELSFVNNSVPQELAPTPIGQSVNLQLASPFFNDQTRALLAPLDTNNDGYVTTNVGFRFNQSGPRNVDANRTAFRILGGVRGDIAPKLQYEAYYSYARTRNSQFQQGNIARSRFGFALNTSFDAAGNLQCADAGARAAGCVPLNIFGLGLADQDAIDYVTINSNNTEISELQNAVAVVSGSLFNLGLGAGDVGFALGGEYRRMSSQYIPDTFLASGDVAGFNAGQPTSGSYDVKEIFGELRVPIIEDGFIDLLELNGAARYSDYSLGNVGGVWTYAGGVNIAPVPDILFRGNYQRSVRAPNVQDLFGGNSTGFPAAQDPCSDRGPANTRTDAVRALCIASGVPAANVFTRAVQPNAQIQANFGGNPNLSEETSDTYTVGAVIRPSFIPRLNITVDYFNIKVEDVISTFAGGLNSALSLCYTVAQDLSNPICQAFTGLRNPATGALGETSGGGNPNILSANIADLETSGIDVQVDYNMPLGFSLFGNGESRVNFFYLGTYLDRYRSTAVASIPERVTIAEGSFSGNPLPQYRHTTRLTYSDGPASLSLRWRYFGKVQDFRIENTFSGLDRVGTDPALLVNPFVSEVNYFDLTANVDVSDNFTLTMGVNNLFDEKPEVLGSLQEQANTYPGSYDVLGRDFFVGARLQF